MPHFIALFVCCLLAAMSTRLRAEDAPTQQSQVVVSADFENEDASAVVAESHRATAVVTEEPAEVVEGKRSLKGDSTKGGGQWNEFFHSRQGLFAPKEAYVVSFDYKVLSREGNAKFYALFRRPRGGGGNEGWRDWQGSPGDTGRVAMELYTKNVSDYYLILGIQHKGAIAIDNLTIRSDPAKRPPNYKLPEPKRTWKSPGNKMYHVDSTDGDDAGEGTSPGQAWRTLTKVNQGEFAPGDKILLKAGSKWHDYLSPGGRGSEGAPIVVDSYGEGPKPSVDAQGKFLATLYLLNTEHIEVSNLDLANEGDRRQAGRAGVHVRLDDFGEAHHIHLKNLDVHDVNGSNVKKDGGGSGIKVTRGGATTKSRYVDLLIDGCRLERTDRNGINFAGYWTRKDWYPNLNVVIRNCVLEDFGGDGIVPIGCDGALVEHNVLRDGRQRCRDAAAGIWPWSCDNTVIQFNEVSGMKGTVDGQGYDCDWNCRNTLFQYNYSHNNDGGFMLVCNNGASKMPHSLGNVGSTIRYNISVNDGARIFHISGPCKDTKIYNNVIFLGEKLDVPLLKPGNWGGGWPEDTYFANNVFYVKGRSRFEFGGMKRTVFESNVFFGDIEGVPDDPRALNSDPLFVDPTEAADGFESLAGFKLKPGSPCIGAGTPVPDSGGRDFWGNLVPADGKPDLGAHQRQ